jgi:hypothetical protein
MLRLTPVLFATLLLAGCVEGSLDKLKGTSTAPVCVALIGPIKYNSVDLKSARHAGPKLAPDLKRRNQVGSNLRCPQYRGR